MNYSNSSLVTQSRIITNHCNPRNQPITGITIHHNAGVATVKNLLQFEATTTRETSFNYCIGDNDIGLCVEEKNRAWTSSNKENDYRCVTIEVINSATGGDWPISDKSMATLIKLCADICKRNNIPKLYFDGTKNGTLTYHYMFKNTNCPGPYIKNHTQYICDEVNKLLGIEDKEPEKPAVKTYEVVVSLKGYYTAADAAAGKNAVRDINPGTYYIYNETSEAVNVTKTADVPGAWINKSLNKKEETKPVEPTTPDTSNPIGKDVVINGRLYGTSAGANPGKTVSNLKTKVTRYQKGAKYPYNFTGDVGWAAESSVKFTTNESVASAPTPSTGFKKGDKVKVKSGAKSYFGENIASFVYNNTYIISSISGDRAVLGSSGSINTSFNTKDLILVTSSNIPTTPTKPPIDNTIKVGSKVKVKKGAKSYEGKKIASFVYNNVYTVDQLSGKRAVLDRKGICTAFNTNDLIKQ